MATVTVELSKYLQRGFGRCLTSRIEARNYRRHDIDSGARIKLQELLTGNVFKGHELATEAIYWLQKPFTGYRSPEPAIYKP